MFDRYRRILPWLQMAARHHGYALLLHGSTMRDMDLVAVPWMQDAISGAELVRVFRWIADSCQITGPYTKPHGRMCWVLLLYEERPDGQLMYIDLSVMPRLG